MSGENWDWEQFWTMRRVMMVVMLTALAVAFAVMRLA